MSAKLTSETLLEVMNWRYAVKKFDATKKIPENTWKAIAESLRLAPSSYGLQPWKFIVVQDPKIREQLKAQSWNQTQITDCSHLVVLAYKVKTDEAHITKYIESTANIRGMNAADLEGYKKMMIGDIVNGPRSKVIDTWAQKQTYIAMGQSMLAAATLGVDSCPMEGLVPAEYDKILKLEGTGYATVAVIPFGYRHAEDQMQKATKSRFNESDVIQYI